MMSERQKMIAQNNQKIEALQAILNQDKEYQKYTSLVGNLKLTLKRHDQKEKELENQRSYHQQAVINHSHMIQNITEQIEAKKEQMNILNMILNQYQKNGKKNILFLFLQYYDEKQKINQEELHEKEMLSSVFLKFVQIYGTLQQRKNQELQAKLNLSEWEDPELKPLLMSVPFITTNTSKEIKKLLQLPAWHNSNLQSILKTAICFTSEDDAKTISKTGNIEYLEYHTLMRQYQEDIQVLEKQKIQMETKLQETRKFLRQYPEQMKTLKRVQKELQKFLTNAEQQLYAIAIQRKPIENKIIDLIMSNCFYKNQYYILRETYMRLSTDSTVIAFEKQKIIS